MNNIHKINLDMKKHFDESGNFFFWMGFTKEK